MVANLTRTGGSSTVTIRPLDPIEDSAAGNTLMAARWDKVKADQAIMNMVFGSDGQQSLLFATQLMSAFGPGDAGDGDGKPGENSGGFDKAFGNLMG